eukprot:2399076-Rhodomonas_salina.1
MGATVADLRVRAPAPCASSLSCLALLSAALAAVLLRVCLGLVSLLLRSCLSLHLAPSPRSLPPSSPPPPLPPQTAAAQPL